MNILTLITAYHFSVLLTLMALKFFGARLQAIKPDVTVKIMMIVNRLMKKPFIIIF